MNIEKILEAAASDPDLSETYAFKLTAKLKNEFVEVCSIHGVSTGRVMRELLTEFVAKVNK